MSCILHIWTYTCLVYRYLIPKYRWTNSTGRLRLNSAADERYSDIKKPRTYPFGPLALWPFGHVGWPCRTRPARLKGRPRRLARPRRHERPRTCAAVHSLFQHLCETPAATSQPASELIATQSPRHTRRPGKRRPAQASRPAQVSSRSAAGSTPALFSLPLFRLGAADDSAPPCKGDCTLPLRAQESDDSSFDAGTRQSDWTAILPSITCSQLVPAPVKPPRPSSLPVRTHARLAG